MCINCETTFTRYGEWLCTPCKETLTEDEQTTMIDEAESDEEYYNDDENDRD